MWSRSSFPPSLPLSFLLHFYLHPSTTAISSRGTSGPFLSQIRSLNWQKTNTAIKLICFLPGYRTAVAQQRVQCVSASEGTGLSDGAQGWEEGSKGREGKRECNYHFPRHRAVGLASSNTAPHTKQSNCYSHPGFRVKFNLKKLCLLTKITTKFKRVSFNVFRRWC